MFGLKLHVSLRRILFAAAAVSFLPCIVAAESADSAIQEGITLYQDNEFDQAREKFLEARVDRPEDPNLAYNLANSQYKSQKFEDALQSYSRAVENGKDPDLKKRALYNTGNTLYRMGKLEEAIAAYSKALELDPADMDAKYNLEFTREQLQRQKEQQSQKNQKQQDEPSDASSENQPDDSKNKAENQPPPPNPPDPGDPESQKAETPDERKLTQEEAERWLNALPEDLKKYNRKQAVDMESLFGYQGNDW